MPLFEIDQSPLAVSRRENAHRFFCLPELLYVALKNQVNIDRGYPMGLTRDALQATVSLPTAPDGKKLIAIDCWRFTAADDVMLAPYLANGSIVELTHAEYIALLPTPSFP